MSEFFENVICPYCSQNGKQVVHSSMHECPRVKFVKYDENGNILEVILKSVDDDNQQLLNE